MKIPLTALIHTMNWKWCSNCWGRRRLVRQNMDINGDERQFNITLRDTFKYSHNVVSFNL